MCCVGGTGSLGDATSISVYWYNNTCRTVALQTVCTLSTRTLVTGLVPNASNLDGSGRLVVTIPSGTPVPAGFAKLAAYTANAINNGSDPVIINFVDYGEIPIVNTHCSHTHKHHSHHTHVYSHPMQDKLHELLARLLSQSQCVASD